MDGLSVNVSLTFQYKLNDTLNNVLRLFYNYGENDYQKAFTSYARDSIQNTFSTLMAMQLFNEKGCK
jgi:hypothetical protein